MNLEKTNLATAEGSSSNANGRNLKSRCSCSSHRRGHTFQNNWETSNFLQSQSSLHNLDWKKNKPIQNTHKSKGKFQKKKSLRKLNKILDEDLDSTSNIFPLRPESPKNTNGLRGKSHMPHNCNSSFNNSSCCCNSWWRPSLKFNSIHSSFFQNPNCRINCLLIIETATITNYSALKPNSNKIKPITPFSPYILPLLRKFCSFYIFIDPEMSNSNSRLNFTLIIIIIKFELSNKLETKAT